MILYMIQGNTKTAYETLGALQTKTNDNFSSDSQSDRERSEPESEFDRVSADSPVDIPHPPKKQKQSRNGRRTSLINISLKLQRMQELKELLQQSQPAHIYLSDLAADWSRYISKQISCEPTLVSIPMKDVHAKATSRLPRPPAAIQDSTLISLERTNQKRISKKSLIDKAAVQQLKDVFMECTQPDSPEWRAPKSNFQAYCSLCTRGKNRQSCVLCGNGSWWSMRISAVLNRQSPRESSRLVLFCMSLTHVARRSI